MIAIFVLFLSLKSVTAPGANPMPLLTPTHKETMSEAKRNLIEIGQRFNRLVVVERAGKNKWGATIFRCQCDCGNETRSSSQSLLNGDSQSCGCLRREKFLQLNTSHLHSRTPIYRVWSSIIQRCTNPNNQKWTDYGGRGITVCERWLKFEYFLADVGERPNNRLTLERKDNDLGYCKENCKWATRKVQMNNRRNNHRITIDGRTQTLTQWCREFRIHPNTVQNRINRGSCSSYKEALTNPIQRKAPTVYA